MKIVTHTQVPASFEGGRLLEQEGQWAAAAVVYEQLSKKFPHELRNLIRLMIVYRKLKDHKKEISSINRAIKIIGQYYSPKKLDKRTIPVSKKLNLLLGHTDKKGKPIMVPEEIRKLEVRMNNLMNRLK